MREPPATVADAEVLALVRATWLPDAESIAHLPLGFGAHHRGLTALGGRGLFVTRVARAPAERDLSTLGEGDPAMLRMFDLEWRLSEIREYVAWFAGSHGGGADDAAAFADLVEELERP